MKNKLKKTIYTLVTLGLCLSLSYCKQKNTVTPTDDSHATDSSYLNLRVNYKGNVVPNIPVYLHYAGVYGQYYKMAFSDSKGLVQFVEDTITTRYTAFTLYVGDRCRNNSFSHNWGNYLYFQRVYPFLEEVFIQDLATIKISNSTNVKFEVKFSFVQPASVYDSIHTDSLKRTFIDLGASGKSGMVASSLPLGTYRIKTTILSATDSTFYSQIVIDKACDTTFLDFNGKDWTTK